MSSKDVHLCVYVSVQRCGHPVQLRCVCVSSVCVCVGGGAPDLGLLPRVCHLSVKTAWRGSAGPGSTPKPIPEDKQLTRVHTQAPKITRIHTVRKPITAAHYWAGQVQVLTRTTINPRIPSGQRDVRSERLTRLNVRAVASVMRQDNCAVFQPARVNSHWPWG